MLIGGTACYLAMAEAGLDFRVTRDLDIVLCVEARGISFVGPEYLLPLKAKAWLDLSKRKLQGEDIDSKALRKHKNDIFRLYPVLNPAFGGKIPHTIKRDLREFFARMETEIIDLKSLDLKSTTIESILADLGKIFCLNQRD